jgi:hypothetical protein
MFLIKSTFVKYEYEGILFEEVLFCSDILKTSSFLQRRLPAQNAFLKVQCPIKNMLNAEFYKRTSCFNRHTKVLVHVIQHGIY